MLLKSIVEIMRKRKLSIAVAESCSGGYLSYLLTKIPGSSQVFKGGFVVYSLEAKNRLFKIPFSLLKKTEGVSEKVSLFLAKKVKKVLGADLGVSLVGFAGPKVKKGVKCGTVFITLVDKNSAKVKKIIIKGGREQVRKKASYFALDLIQSRLIKKNGL